MKDLGILQNIIFFDSSFDFEDLKTLTNDNSSIIITFDFESHKLLLENHVEHYISDNFITKKDLSEIQNKSYNFTDWYKDKSISNLLTYEDVNLGNLFYGEFRLFLIPLLKKFLEITKIYQKFPDAIYFSTYELFPFISVHTSNVKKINFYEKHAISSSHNIKYGFNFGGKYFSISLPNKYFRKIKNLSELFLKNRFNSKINKNKKTVLLLEFSPLRFKHFFLNIPHSDINVVLHNRRFPSVWNTTSYSILKNSTCVVTTHHTLMDKNTKKLINENVYLVNSQIKQLWNDDSFFEDFFKFHQISFWNILKPFFENMFEQHISEYIYEIELTKKLFNKYNFSSILITSEMNYHEQIAIILAKKFNIKIALIQHGLYEETPEALEYNNLAVLPHLSDKFLVWGESLKKYSIDSGISPNKIEIIGNPAYDDFFIQSKKSISNNSFVLLTTTNPQLDTVNDLMMNSYLEREKAIEQICHITTKLNKKLVIKLHPHFNEIDITNFVHKINPEITVIKYGNVLDLIKDCELFITLNISTTILEAQIFNKSTMSLFVTDRGFGCSEIFKSGSCISVLRNDFEKIFTRLINDKRFRNESIRCGQQFSHSYLSYQGSASQKLIDFLEKF